MVTIPCLGAIEATSIDNFVRPSVLRGTMLLKMRSKLKDHDDLAPEGNVSESMIESVSEKKGEHAPKIPNFVLFQNL